MNDKKLSPHFSLYDLTRTDHADLQSENRVITAEQEFVLRQLADLLENVKIILGCDLDIHSAYRCPKLNDRVGSSAKSQHLRCEAADFSPAGPDSEQSVVDAWQKIATAAREKRIKFGQLIVESQAGRDGGRKFWVHISLGAPYRDKARCGEVLTMKDGKFEMISKLG